MKPRLNDNILWIGCAGHWRAARPLHAYVLIAEEDRRLAASGARWRCVQVIPFVAFHPADFNIAELYYEALDAERAALLAESAETDARLHTVRAMRAIYEACAVHLRKEAQRLGRVAA